MESKKLEFNKHFAEIQNRAKEREAFYKDLSSNIKNITSEFRELSKIDAAEKKDILLKSFNTIQNKVAELNNNAFDICNFLYSERTKYHAIVIQATIDKNGYERTGYQDVIDKVINPFIQQWEMELDFQKKHDNLKTLPFNHTEPSQEIKSIKEKIKIEETNSIETDKKKDEVLTKVDLELPQGFMQINCPASKEEILNYFMILAKEKNMKLGKVFMQDEDVLGFVQKNFEIFNSTPTGKYFPINLTFRQKGVLVYFMFLFQSKYDNIKANNKIKYVNLLINNFTLFKDDNPNILIGNMSESKKPKMYTIPTK